jgi:hypothetical protein
VTANFGPLDHFTFNTIGTQTAGIPFTVRITAVDALGNTVTGYTGVNTLCMSSNSTCIHTTAFTSSVWTGSITAVTAPYFPYPKDQISTTGTGSHVPGLKSGASNTFTLNPSSSPPPAAVDHFTFATISPTQRAGTSFTITITAKDASGKTVTGYAGSNSLSDTSGTISPTATGSFTSGVWTGSVTITKAGTGDVISTSGGKSGTSGAFTVNSGLVPTQFIIATISSPQTRGVAFSITVTAQDAYGNTVTGYNAKNSLKDLSGTLNTMTGSFTACVWTGSVTITKASASDYITTSATIGGVVKSGTSNTFNVV